MSYNINTNILPSGSSFYIKEDSTNPKVIEAGASATLKFMADGTFYKILPSQASAVQVVGATIGSWSCEAPNTLATLTISNPTSDVTVTINGKVVISPISINGPLKINAKAAVDTRIVLTKQQMTEVIDSMQPDYYFAVCKDDKKIYIYSKDHTVDASTGKFRPIEDFLTFTTPEAKAQLNEAIKNSVQIATINQEIAELQEDVTEIQGDVSSVVNRVNILEPKVTTLETKVGDDQSGLIKRINEAEADIAQVEADIDQAQEDITVIQTWINNVKLDGGEVKAYYALTGTLSNVTGAAGNPTQIPYKTATTLTFTANSGCVLPETVTVNGTNVGSEATDCGYVSAYWIKASGKLYLDGATGACNYTITGVAEGV